MTQLYFKETLVGNIKNVQGFDFPWMEGLLEVITDDADILQYLEEQKIFTAMSVDKSYKMFSAKNYTVYVDSEDWKIVYSDGETYPLAWSTSVEKNGRITWR